MKKRTVYILAFIGLILLFGISGLILEYAGSIPALSDIPAMSGATLNVSHSIDASNFPALSLGSCCICIPIPLALGLFALSQQAKS